MIDISKMVIEPSSDYVRMPKATYKIVQEAFAALEEAKIMIRGYDKYFSKHFEDQGLKYNPQKEWLLKYFGEK